MTSSPEGSEFSPGRWDEAVRRQSLSGPLGSYSAVQMLFLLRLARLLALEREYANSASRDDWRRKLLNKATYSAFCDCVGLGVERDARALFQRERAKPLG